MARHSFVKDMFTGKFSCQNCGQPLDFAAKVGARDYWCPGRRGGEKGKGKKSGRTWKDGFEEERAKAMLKEMSKKK